MTNNINQWEEKLRQFIEACGAGDAAHEIGHIERVVKWSKKFATEENGDLNIVVPAAWLHDCVHVPKNSPDRAKGSLLAANKATEFLREISYPESYLPAIHHAIHAHSFTAKITPETIEAKVVQDADRIEAIGAIGIARCLMLGGELKRKFISPIDTFCVTRPPDDSNFALDHFYTKLLSLTDTMQTNAGRREGKRRHNYLVGFLEQLKSELN